MFTVCSRYCDGRGFVFWMLYGASWVFRSQLVGRVPGVALENVAKALDLKGGYTNLNCEILLMDRTGIV